MLSSEKFPDHYSPHSFSKLPALLKCVEGSSSQQAFVEEEDPGAVFCGTLQATPAKFSIRDYVADSRRRNVETNWPFPKPFLQLCVKRGVDDILPPFELPILVRAQCRRREEEGKPKGDPLDVLAVPVYDEAVTGVRNHVDVEKISAAAASEFHDLEFFSEGGSGESLEAKIAEPSEKLKEPKLSERTTEKKQRLVVKFSSSQKITRADEVTPNSVAGTCPMASKVCPVCKVFASTSNTTLNAHIDRCLSTESGPEQVVAKFTGLKLKPSKKRSMADIYETAPLFTLEDLDRRNNTTWSTDLAAFSTPIGKGAQEIKRPKLSMPGSGNGCAVYVDSNGVKIRILSEFDDNPVEKACGNIDEKHDEQDGIVRKVYPPIWKGKHKMLKCGKHMKNQSKEAATTNKVQEEMENGDQVCSQHVNEDPMQKTSNAVKSIHEDGLCVLKERACFENWDSRKKIKSKRMKRNLESLNPDCKSRPEEKSHLDSATGKGSQRPPRIAAPQKFTDRHDKGMRIPRSCRSLLRLKKHSSMTRRFRKFSYIADTTEGGSSAEQSFLKDTLLSENALIAKDLQCPTRNPEPEKDRQSVESTEDEGKTTSETRADALKCTDAFASNSPAKHSSNPLSDTMADNSCDELHGIPAADDHRKSIAGMESRKELIERRSRGQSVECGHMTRQELEMPGEVVSRAMDNCAPSAANRSNAELFEGSSIRGGRARLEAPRDDSSITWIAVSSDEEDNNGSAADVEQSGSPASSVSTIFPRSLEDTTALDDSVLKPWATTQETEAHSIRGSTRNEGLMIPASWTRSRGAVNLQVRTPSSAFCAYSKANSMESMVVQSPSGSISMLSSADSAREPGAASKLPPYNTSPSATTTLKPILRLMGKNLMVASTEDARHIPRSTGFVSASSNASTAPESDLCCYHQCPHHGRQQWQLPSARGGPVTYALRHPMFIHEMPLLHQVNGFSSSSPQVQTASIEGHGQLVLKGRTREASMPYMPWQAITDLPFACIPHSSTSVPLDERRRWR